MIEKARAKRVDFLLVNMPWLEQGFPSDTFLEEVASSKDQEWYDIRNAFIEMGLDKGDRYKGLSISPNDNAHYSAYGGRILQNALIEYLLRTGRIPAPDARIVTKDQ